ncbi:MAG: hypothetical protein IPL26_13280 [Leptospiraceae bacterium]|nr:hypothetical protein [Leptospiraceae bacterium]
MIFELRDKIPRNSSFLNSEDVLTSNIFGTLRYFSNQNILISFLNKSINMEGKKLEIAINSNFNIEFWKKYKKQSENFYDEPDLVLIDKNNVILIECKYHSFIYDESYILENKKIYSNQIIRYSVILNRNEFNNKNKYIIFLSNDSVFPTQIMADSKSKINNADLYWLSWHKLFGILNKENAGFLSEGEQIIRKDLLNFLKKRNLKVFDGFTIENSSLNWKYKRRKKYFDNIQNTFQWSYKK